MAIHCNLSGLVRGLAVSAVAMFVAWQGLDLPAAYAAGAGLNLPKGHTITATVKRAKGAGKSGSEAAMLHLPKGHTITATVKRAKGAGKNGGEAAILHLPKGHTIIATVKRAKGAGKSGGEAAVLNLPKGHTITAMVKRARGAGKSGGEAAMLHLPKGHTVTATVKRAKGAGKTGGEAAMLNLPKGHTITATVKRAKGAGKNGGEAAMLHLPKGHTITATVKRAKGAGKTGGEAAMLHLPKGHTITATVKRARGAGKSGGEAAILNLPKGHTITATVKRAKGVKPPIEKKEPPTTGQPGEPGGLVVGSPGQFGGGGQPKGKPAGKGRHGGRNVGGGKALALGELPDYHTIIITVTRDRAGVPGDDLDCPDCGVEVVRVIHESGNDPLDTTNPVAYGSTNGTGGGMTVVTTGGGGTTGGGTADTTPPVVTAPASIHVGATSATGVPSSNATIAAFLNGATATDNVGVSGPITNNAPAIFPTTPQVFIKSGFPFGASTPVTFTARDAAGNTGTATANVEVFDFTGPSYTTGACALPIVHAPLGTSVSINDPTVQSFITCVKGAFTDNIDGVIPASSVVIFNDPTPNPLPLYDNPPVSLPAAPTSFPAPTSIPSGSTNAVRMSPINFKAADKAKNLGWFFTVVTVISP